MTLNVDKVEPLHTSSNNEKVKVSKKVISSNYIRLLNPIYYILFCKPILTGKSKTTQKNFFVKTKCIKNRAFYINNSTWIRSNRAQ